MNVYVIGTVRDARSKILGYTLLDTDDNNRTVQVDKQNLINAVRSGKLKLVNAKLNKNAIQGTCYSLGLLSYHVFKYGKQEYVNKGVLVLDRINNDYKVLVTDRMIAITVVDANTLSRLVNARQVINVDENGRILYKESGTALDVSSSKLSDLDMKMLNKDAVVTIEEFAQFMAQHKWDYKIEKTTYTTESAYQISDIDPNCNVIHLPKNCIGMKNIYSAKPLVDLRLLVLNGECKAIYNVFNGATINTGSDEYLLTINKMYIQPSNSDKGRRIELRAFKKICIQSILDLADIDDIYDSFDYCYLNKVVSNKKIDINHSFNHAKFNNPEIELNCNVIGNSYCDVSNVSKITIIAARTISQSFNDNTFTSLVFKDTKLFYIANSFKNNSGLREVDLSNVQVVESLGGFSECANLKRFVLPKRADGCQGYFLADQFLVKTGMKELTINSDVIYVKFPILNENGTVIFDESVKTLSKSFLRNYGIAGKEGCPTIKFMSNNITIMPIVLTTLPYSRGRTLENLGIRGEQITKLHVQSLATYGAKTIDTSKLTNITSLSNRIFEGSQVETLIIGDNIKSVGEQILKDCYSLKTIVISPNTTDIDSKAFTYIRNSQVIRVYAVKGSVGYQLIDKRKKNGFILTDVESVDDALDIISNGQATNEKKKAKFNIVLNNSKYSKLLEPEYINNVQFMYNIYRRLEEGYVPDNIIKLNTHKYVNIALKETDRLYKILCGTHKNEERPLDAVYFTSISNLITVLFDNYSRLTNQNIINYINELATVNVQEIILSGTKFTICIASIKFNDAYSLRVLIIELGGSIRFMTPVNSGLFNHDLVHDELKNFNDKRIHKMNCAVSELVSAGDTIALRSIISNIDFPVIYYDNVKQSIIRTGFFNNTIVICFGYSALKADKHGKTDILMYDVIGQKFIVGHCQTNLYSKFSNSSSVGILDIYDVNSSSKIIKNLRNTINEFGEIQADIDNFLRYMSITETERMVISADINNYDTKGNRELLEIAKYCAMYNYENIWDMPEIARNKLFSTDLFGDMVLTANAINNNRDLRTVNRKLTNLGIHMELHSYVNTPTAQNYLYFTLPQKVSGKTRIKLKVCSIGHKAVLDLLGKINETMVNKTEAINRIGNFEVDRSRFFKLSGSEILYGLEFMIEKASGYSYITYVINDNTKVVPIFRFKNIQDGWDLYSTYFANSNQNSNTVYLQIGRDIIESVERYINTGVEQANSVWMLRESIINGLPNGFPYITGIYRNGKMEKKVYTGVQNRKAQFITKLLDILAKQPPIN